MSVNTFIKIPSNLVIAARPFPPHHHSLDVEVPELAVRPKPLTVQTKASVFLPHPCVLDVSPRVLEPAVCSGLLSSSDSPQQPVIHCFNCNSHCSFQCDKISLGA